jgi:hypothetical protein
VDWQHFPCFLFLIFTAAAACCGSIPQTRVALLLLCHCSRAGRWSGNISGTAFTAACYIHPLSQVFFAVLLWCHCRRAGRWSGRLSATSCSSPLQYGAPSYQRTCKAHCTGLTACCSEWIQLLV